jgi:hypothetical protein
MQKYILPLFSFILLAIGATAQRPADNSAQKSRLWKVRTNRDGGLRVLTVA